MGCPWRVVGGGVRWWDLGFKGIAGCCVEEQTHCQKTHQEILKYLIVMLWFKKRNIYLVFNLFLAQRFLKPLEFPKWWEGLKVGHVTEVTFGTPTDHLRMRLQRNQRVVKGLELPVWPLNQPPSTPPLGRGDGWRLKTSPIANDLINRAYVTRPP